MEKLNQEIVNRYRDQIQLFVKLAFEGSADYPLYLNVVKTVGINSLFPCLLYYQSNDGTKTHHEAETSFLQIALFYKNEDLLRFLLDNGADPNGALSDGEPPIWDLQYEYDDPEYGLRATKLLLAYGADPNYVWEDESFYYYVDTKPADIISSQAECDYLIALSSLLRDYGGRHG